MRGKTAELHHTGCEREASTRRRRSTPGARVLHDRDLAVAIVDRILERGHFLKLDGPSLRTKHLGLDEATEEASTQPAQFPEPAGKSFRNPHLA